MYVCACFPQDSSDNDSTDPESKEIDYPDEPDESNSTMSTWSSWNEHHVQSNSNMWVHTLMNQIPVINQFQIVLDPVRREERKREVTTDDHFVLLDLLDAENFHDATLMKSCQCPRPRPLRKRSESNLLFHAACGTRICWICGSSDVVSHEKLRCPPSTQLSHIEKKSLKKMRRFMHVRRIWSQVPHKKKYELLKRMNFEEIRIFMSACLYRR